jgi:hypothetical protein
MCEAKNNTIYKQCRDILWSKGVRRNHDMQRVLILHRGCMTGKPTFPGVLPEKGVVDKEKIAVLASSG